MALRADESPGNRFPRVLFLPPVIGLVIAAIASWPTTTAHGSIKTTTMRVINAAAALKLLQHEGDPLPAGGDEVVWRLSRPSDGRPPVLPIYRDQWGRTFRYRCPVANGSPKAAIWSSGPNGIDEGGCGDDICEYVRLRQ